MTDAAGSEPLDAAALVERAIESVLDQVPDLPDTAVPENATRVQPWADVAAPAGKNKRPLEELLAEYAERVAAAPGAVAGHPAGPRPEEVFFDHLTHTGRGTPGPGGGAASGRRRRRRGRGSPGDRAPATAGAPATPGANHPSSGRKPGGPAPTGQASPGGAAKRRRRRGRRGRGGGTGTGGTGGGSDSGA